MDELMLDGNAAAGSLASIFGLDVTAATATCAGCGASSAVGAVRVFRSAGTVFRCPTCGSVVMTIVETQARTWISMRGLRALELHS
jgi:predicted RNA-binding Zn-ribbon protein involved in translation (DUF1610 family)